MAMVCMTWWGTSGIIVGTGIQPRITSMGPVTLEGQLLVRSVLAEAAAGVTTRATAEPRTVFTARLALTTTTISVSGLPAVQFHEAADSERNKLCRTL
jgi:hypothetical protein